MVRRLFAVASLAVLVAGCGGGGGDDDTAPLSTSAFRAKANQICRDAQQANEDALKAVDRDDTSALAQATQAAGQRTRDALSALDDLEGPDTAEDQVDRLVSRAEDFGDALQRQADALADNDAAAAQAAQDEARRLNDEAQQAARDAGLADCAS